jgi:Fur family peroxide stress response transcriptional regulator
MPDHDRPPGRTLGGGRSTHRRQEVYDILLERRDHPTATEVFLRVKDRVPSISLATVYNCLETLTEAGLVRQVNLDRAPSRYCPNLEAHGHFHCTGCGRIMDVDFRDRTHQSHLRLPRGSVVDQIEVAIKGRCPACAGKSAKPRAAGSRSDARKHN